MASSQPTRPPEAGDDDGPLRRCIASGESKPAETMIRFVVGPDGSVVPDVDERLPGRGLWITADRASLERAVAKGLFARAARRPLVVAPGLPAQVEGLVARRCLSLLGLARRAGAAVAGYEKVRLMVSEPGLRLDRCLLFTASDAGPDGQRRFRGVAGETTEVECMTAAELGLPFGRERTVHALVRGDRPSGAGLVAALGRETARLAGLRDGNLTRFEKR